MATQTTPTEVSVDKPRFNKLVDWIPIHSYTAAVAHYVDRLGFKIDGEWRQAKGQPVLMEVSRDDVTIGLGEDHSGKTGAQLGSTFEALQLSVQDLAPQVRPCHGTRLVPSRSPGR